MRIKCLDTFLDGKNRFEKGDFRTVPDEDATRFIKNGWAAVAGAVEEPPEPAAENVTLDIESSRIGQVKRNG